MFSISRSPGLELMGQSKWEFLLIKTLLRTFFVVRQCVRELFLFACSFLRQKKKLLWKLIPNNCVSFIKTKKVAFNAMSRSKSFIFKNVSTEKKCFFTWFSTNCFVDLEISENLKGLVLSSVIFGGSYPQYSV